MTEPDHQWSETLCIPASHPSLPGHFPGEPVVAAVIVLDFLAASLERKGHGALQRISSVKFRAPLLPEESADLQIAVSAKQVRFSLSRDGALLATGDGELA